MKPALLALADGRVFRGEGCGATGEAQGEVVFNASKVGYQEILSDPSATHRSADRTASKVLLTTVGGVPVAL